MQVRAFANSSTITLATALAITGSLAATSEEGAKYPGRAGDGKEAIVMHCESLEKEMWLDEARRMCASMRGGGVYIGPQGMSDDIPLEEDDNTYVEATPAAIGIGAAVLAGAALLWKGVTSVISYGWVGGAARTAASSEAAAVASMAMSAFNGNNSRPAPPPPAAPAPTHTIVHHAVAPYDGTAARRVSTLLPERSFEIV